jgi:hypothetical protein
MILQQVHIQKKYFQEAGECETVLIDSAKYRKLIAMKIY